MASASAWESVEHESGDSNEKYGEFGNFLESVLNTQCLGRVDFSDGTDASLLKADIEQFVKAIADSVCKLDGRFKCSVLLSGSCAENTKVGHPDEFDFMFVLDKFSDIVDIEHIDLNTGLENYVAFKPKPDIPTEYREFIDDGYLGSTLIQHKFSHLLNKVLYLSDPPVEGTCLMLEFPHLFLTDVWQTRGPATDLRVEWTKCKPHVTVSLDIVASLFIPKWLGDVDPRESPIITEELKAFGCYAVHKDTHLFDGRELLEITCTEPYAKTREDLYNKHVWRLSFSNVECHLLNQTKAGRDAYALTKIFLQLNPSMINFVNAFYSFGPLSHAVDVCCSENPQVWRFNYHLHVLHEKGIYYKPTSYMLKNVFFHVLNDFHKSGNQMDYSNALVYFFNKIMSVVENCEDNKNTIQTWFFNSSVSLGFGTDFEQLAKGMGSAYPILKDIKENHISLLRKIKLAGIFMDVGMKVMACRETFKNFKMDDAYLASLPAKVDFGRLIFPAIDHCKFYGANQLKEWEDNLFVMLQIVAKCLMCLPANHNQN